MCEHKAELTLQRQFQDQKLSQQANDEIEVVSSGGLVPACDCPLAVRKYVCVVFVNQDKNKLIVPFFFLLIPKPHLVIN